MLFVTFLQVPVAALGQAMRSLRFLAVLLGVNFIFVPLLVAGLLPLAPDDPLLRLGILIVLLCPCIDYVVRSEEHTSELQSLMRISYAVFCLKKKQHMKTI